MAGEWNKIPVRSVRLADDYLSALDAVAEWWEAQTGIKHSRGKALEYLLIHHSIHCDDPKLRERLRSILS